MDIRGKKQEKGIIYRYINYTFHEFKILKRAIITETFNVDFHNKLIKFWVICSFYFSW